MTPNFEWDEEKARANLRRHKVSFDEAITVFTDPFSVTILDPERTVGEQRYIDIGTSDKGRLLAVYTERGRIYASSVAGKQPARNAGAMRKGPARTVRANADGMRAEYDFTGGVRGKHFRAMEAGYTITIRKPDGRTVVKDVKPKEGAVILAPDVQEYFADSETVNTTLRSLIRLIPKRRTPVSSKAARAAEKRS